VAQAIRKAAGGLAVLVIGTVGCSRDRQSCPECETLVVAAVSEPSTLFPPLVGETVGRDIGDQVFERLADLRAGAASIDTTAYQPALAARWERADSLAWRFHLRPGARWHDGRPVTAEDVRFSFAAFSDTAIGSPAQSTLAGRVAIVPEDSATFLVRFTEPSPEQLYDATYHVRIIPAHVWGSIAKGAWSADTALGHLVGSGPYRVAQWKRGEFLTLVADSNYAPAPTIRRAIWRFTSDLDAALNLVLSHEADVLEAAAGPDRERRAAADSSVRVVRYPSAAYGFLGFNLVSPRGGAAPHPVLGDRGTRRALALAIDRATAAKSVFGPSAKAPPGPMSQLLWLWSDSISTLPFDRDAARRELDALGWRTGPDGTRVRQGRRLAFDILVPTTSASRRQLAVVLQEMWRAAGASATVTAVDFPVFQQRLGQGRFDSYIGAWIDEPSPRGLADQWSRGGWAALNYGHYADPRFDSLFDQASRIAEVGRAGRAYQAALDVLNADAPALFLFAPSNAAVLSPRLRAVEINPYSWASGLRRWRLE
jgi:peptide/nickel transport system substrate-binding protein